MGISILEAIDEASKWMEIDGVEGVAQGQKDGKDCIVVLISRNPSELSDVLPSTFKGFPVILEESGSISVE